MPHGVPFGSLCVVSYGTGSKQSSEDKRQDIVVYLIDDVGNQYLAAETNHLADGGKVNVKGRQPSYKVKSSDVDNKDVCKLLPSQTPVRIAVECQRDAHYTTAHQSEEPRNGFLAVHHVSEHIGSMGYANAR